MNKSLLVFAAVVLVTLVAVFASASMESYIKRTSGKWLKETAALDSAAVVKANGAVVQFFKKGTEAGAKSPTAGDACDMSYHGTLKNGDVFDSSYRRGSPTSFAPQQVVPCWTEVMQLMSEGDGVVVTCPSASAYGERGSPPKIPGHAALRFVMEMHKVKAGGKPAEDAHKRFEEQTGKVFGDMPLIDMPDTK